MAKRDISFQRGDVRARTRRDVDRRRRRTPGDQFWRSLGFIGSVGWPIVLFATGGALLGHELDRRVGTDVHVTLGLLLIGAVLGTIVAYRTLREDGS